eukprot:Skav222192  [mRNA]  locus=scaffold1745:39014:39319:- [translate_table: standard]
MREMAKRIQFLLNESKNEGSLNLLLAKETCLVQLFFDHVKYNGRQIREVLEANIDFSLEHLLHCQTQGVTLLVDSVRCIRGGPGILGIHEALNGDIFDPWN